ncbi:ATP-dependent DNA helicase [Trichonephila inaurata madagascariensis]|uniref:ATP-dependent DNA helicase n=1 Tax=Trichonephila inaurata madagascariensis TaxID=2747483 RepID=A0A8X6X9I1_9ARAC|nr:ATP-dependent DNA helicase [Trichonephila inaurata madagascariensis]
MYSISWLWGQRGAPEREPLSLLTRFLVCLSGWKFVTAPKVLIWIEQFAYTQLVRQVDAHNTAVLDRYRVKVRVFKIRSQDVMRNVTRNADNVNMDNIVSGDINTTGRLQKELEIFNGARVMFRSIINIEQGPLNGAMSITTEIVWPLLRHDQIYDTDISSVRIDFGRDGIHLIKSQNKYSFQHFEIMEQ